jgi:predicted nuclease with TOPRIM domain
MSLFNFEESEQLRALFQTALQGAPEAVQAYQFLLEALRAQGKIQSIETFVKTQEADLAALSQHLQQLQDQVQQLQTQWRELLYTQRNLPEKVLLDEIYPLVDVFLK